MPHLSTAERIGREIGREEGRIVGKVEGRRELLLDQVAVKFGPLTDVSIVAINHLTEEKLDQLGKDILTANSLNELGLTG